MPQPLHFVVKTRERTAVAAYAIVGIMPAHFRTQFTVLLRHRLMAVLFAPIPDAHQGGMELLALGLAEHGVPSPPRRRPIMGKAKEMLDPTFPWICGLRTYVA